MKKIILFALACITLTAIHANNIKIKKGPVIIHDYYETDSILKVRFDLSWDNSWRSHRVGNYDAAWVFMKYSSDSFLWKHAYLKDDGHSIGNSGGLDTVCMTLGRSKIVKEANALKNTGIFIYRGDLDTYGSMSLNDVELVWDCKGVPFSDTTLFAIRVFAIEMVYVPEGGYTIGDNISPERLMKYGNHITARKSAVAWGATDQWLDNNGLRDKNGVVRVSKIPTMNADVTSSGIASGGYLSSNNPYRAFDNNSSTNWHSSAASGWHTLTYQFAAGYGIKATWMLISMYNDEINNLNYKVQGFYVEGSNDNVVWKVVHGNKSYLAPNTNSEAVFFGNQQWTPVVFDFPGHFEYYRFHFYVNQYVVVREIKLFDDEAEDINRIVDESPLTLYNYNGGVGAPIPAEFPKGTNGFYMMKHELTQSAWVDFLNSLSFLQQRRLTPSNVAPFAAKDALLFPNSRIKIRIKEPSSVGEPAVYGVSVNAASWDDENNGGCVPMYGCPWSDMTAYLDWASLRPMTELEYEKACRGDRPRVYFENAWGLATLPNYRATGTTDPYRDIEMPLVAIPATNYAAPSDNGGNHFINERGTFSNWWPLRAGSFANHSTTRREAGAGFYGVLNLSDNVPELYVNITDAQGRAFTGEHGDGDLLEDGAADVVGWPIPNTGSNAGVGYRGIAVYQASASDYRITKILPVSDRRYIRNCFSLTNTSGVREPWTGIRGGRSNDPNAPTLKIGWVN